MEAFWWNASAAIGADAADKHLDSAARILS